MGEGAEGMWEMGYRTGGSKDFSTVRKSVNFHGTRERVFANLSASIVLADGGWRMHWGDWKETCYYSATFGMKFLSGEERWKIVESRSNSNSPLLELHLSLSLDVL